MANFYLLIYVKLAVLSQRAHTAAQTDCHKFLIDSRIGHEGTAILFLVPSEETYVEFIRLNQNVRKCLKFWTCH